VLVGVNDERCYNCGRRNPGLWGFAPALRALGQDLGFVPFVTGTCVILWGLTLVASRGNIGGGGMFSFLSPSPLAMVADGVIQPTVPAGRDFAAIARARTKVAREKIFEPSSNCT
jgi:hypothetical protein